MTTTTTSNFYYYHNDHLSGTTVVTDEAGNLVEVRDYYPYGETRVEQQVGGNHLANYGFTGKEQDSQTGLHYYGSRYYSSYIGRFSQQDPAFLAVGTPALKQITKLELKGYLSDPQLANSYSYARGNPLRYNDPEGEFVWIPVILGALAAAILYDAPAAHAPANIQEAQEYVPNKDFADIAIPGYEKVPESMKIGAGLMVGNKAGSVREGLTGGARGIIKLFHGTTDEAAGRIMREGFRDAGVDNMTWVSNNLEEAMGYASKNVNITKNKGTVLEINLKDDLFEGLKKGGHVEAYEKTKNITNYGFTDEGKNIINNYIKDNPSVVNKIKIK